MQCLFHSLIVLMLALFSTQNALSQDQLRFRLQASTYQGAESHSNEVVVNRPLTIYIPTAFTPNGDGLNDIFSAQGEGLEDFQLVVFDRWGNTVFRSDQIQSGWDGTIDGRNAPTGAYAFEVVARGNDNEYFHEAGKVVLAIND